MLTEKWSAEQIPAPFGYSRRSAVPLRPITAKIVFSPVFRNILNLSQCTIALEKDKTSLKDLLHRLSEETHGRIDSLLFEKKQDRILSGLMVKVNDRLFTGTALNQKQVDLKDNDTVHLMYYISGG